MKTEGKLTLIAVLLLISGTVHAQIVETWPGKFVDLDTVRITPKMQWFIDSTCIAIEAYPHEVLLDKYKKMPDFYFDNLSKRLRTDHKLTRKELIAYEKKMLQQAKDKFPIYRKIYEEALLAKK